MILSRQFEKDAIKQKVLSFKKDGQRRKMVIKSEFTPLSDRTSFKNIEGHLLTKKVKLTLYK